MKNILKNSFWQILFIYSLLVLAMSIGFLWKYSLQMSLFAFIIAFLGLFVLKPDKEIKINPKIHYFLFSLAVLFIILLRVIPYIGNSVPLGYDVGIYKYGIEYGLKNLDNWILQGGMEPGFLYLMEAFKLFFSTDFILEWLFIAFCVLLGSSIYFVSKESFSKETGLIAILIYAVSLIQFKTFWYMYYKNMIGLILALFSIYFLEKSKDNKHLIWLFTLLGGFLGAVHSPTFYIFGLSYLLYTFASPYKYKSYNFKELKSNIFYGVLILLITSFFYLGKFREAILVIIAPVLQSFVQTGESPGTFINFFTYQYSTLAYLPLGILGFLTLIKNKKFNMLFFWALITAIIVYFKFFFFNRFIIHLDVALIILAAYGLITLLKSNKKLSVVILSLLLISGGYQIYQESINSKPLINDEELSLIQSLSLTEQNAFVMSTDSYYSPWVLGYSNRRTIAPGLFDYDTHNYEEWYQFWTTNDTNYTNQFLSVYPKPLYLFIGEYQRMNMEKFNNECFYLINQQNQSYIYKYLC